MINKILDNYFTNKLEKHIESVFLDYIMNTKFEVKKDYIILYAKRIKYNENEYRKFGIFAKERAFEYIVNFKNLKESLVEQIKEYKEQNK